MGEHDTWFSYLPGFHNLQESVARYLQRETMFPGMDRTHFTVTHVLVAVLVVTLLTVAAIAYALEMRRAGDDRVIPDRKFSVRSVFDMVIEATLSTAEGVMGRKDAERFLPLIGTFVFFILFNNLIGLVPGFVSPTDTLKTNLALSGLVLVITQAMGIWTHGIAHLKHFVGPIWWLFFIMVPIELMSNLVIRPASLALRLMGNMFADHKLLVTMTLLVPPLLPLPFYVLGILVCVVQTLVFALLAMIYIGEAVAHEAH